jgi:hypothetical protein
MSTRKKRPYPTQRYSAPHRKMRERLVPIVATGTVRCARCDELISPDAKWELDHKDDGRGWLGPSHANCNRHAGWEQMIRSQSGNGNGGGPGFIERPYRWSQRWSDDPPVGTQVGFGNGKVEVYLGDGQWSEPRPLDRELS